MSEDALSAAELRDQILAARASALDDARPDAVGARRAAEALTARERVAAVLDDGSFVEYGVLADTSPGSPGEGAAAGLVCGAGTVDAVPVVIACYDPTVAAGTQNGLNHAKLERVLWLSREHRWPLVCWVEGEGARPQASYGVGMGIGGGNAPNGVLDGLCELSGWSPTIAVVGGTALSGHAAIAMLSDFVVATQGSRLGALATQGSRLGPLDGRLGVDVHERLGDVDLVVADDATAAQTVRAYVSFQRDLPSGEPSPTADTIGEIVPDNRRRAYDIRKVIHAFADAGSVLELRPNWATSLVTAFARLDGRAVGIFANQPLSPIAGAIDAHAADKLSRFVELCDAYEMPLVSFIDNPGFMVGPKAERDGIARHHARPLAALHHRTVPVYSVQIRKAYGLGPYAMAGWGASRMVPDLRLAWPTVESGGMSLEGAAFLVRRKEIMAAQSPAEVRAIQDEYARTMRDMRSGLRAGQTFQFDDVVDPAETRDRIASMLRLTERRRTPTKKRYIDGI